MRITDLVSFGVPEPIVRLWQKQESDALLPLQELAIRKHGLFGEKNLLIQAPTSSGKTFVGEMAAIHTALQGKKVVYLVPLKALAEEKFLEFQEKYARYGIQIIISTRDNRENDARLESGDFSLAVVVYEKLGQLLVRRPERLEEIRLIIADELEILSDPDRGAHIELLLTRILHSHCRLIGLSAVLGDATGLAEWLQAEPVQYDRRPVELRYGVLHEGVFRYRTYNEFSEGEERLVPLHSDSAGEILAENLCAFVDRGESCLVFVKARKESRRAAELIAQRVRRAAAEHAIEELRGLEPTHSRDALLDTLNNGVAFHNADLSPAERRVIEKAFRQGEIKVMVATSTLAVGLNMPAQNVFISAEKWRYDSRFGMPWKAPISRAEYENMGGRAGRYGSGTPFGRSILIAPTPFDRETLWRRYIDGDRERIQPQLDRASLEDLVVRLVAARTARTEAEVLTFLENTLTGQWVWLAMFTREECAFKVRTAVNRAIEAGLLEVDGEGILDATPFGQAAAAKGITSVTARELRHWLDKSQGRDWSAIDLILTAALTPDGRMLQVALSAQEYDHAGYHDQLKEVTRQEELTVDTPMNRLRNCTLMPFFEEMRAIKVALFLCDWIEQHAFYDIEAKYHVMAGQIRSAAEQVSWLIDAASAIATAFNARDAFIDDIRGLSERVQHGLRPEALFLARIESPRLARQAIVNLVADGFDTPEALAQAQVRLLAQYVGDTHAPALQAWAERQVVPVKQADEGAPDISSGPVLLVDDRHPGEIVLDGITIRLQEKQYRLIRTLAQRPGECVPYERVYEALWDKVVVENNQMHFQKRQLVARIEELVPRRAGIIKTMPKRGFMLDLSPGQVRLHRLPEPARLPLASGQ